MNTSSFTPLHLSNLCELLRLASREGFAADGQVRSRNHAFSACGLAIQADADSEKVLLTTLFLSSRVLPTLEWLSTDAPAGLFESNALTPLGRYVYAVASQEEGAMRDASEALGIRDGVTSAFLLSLPVESSRSRGIRQVPFPFYG